MERKKFLQALAAAPLLSFPFRLLGLGTVDAKTCKTQGDVEGPFYKPNAPARSVIETHGIPLHIEGKVFLDDCSTPATDATLDVWHCDNDGKYDMHGFKGRGQIKTDAEGRYRFTTIFPPPYGTRPRHIHIKVRAQGQRELITQLYFEGDPNLKNDFARNAEKDRVIPLQSHGKVRKGNFNIYL